MSVLITDFRVTRGLAVLARGHLKGPTLKNCYAYSFFSWTSCFLLWTQFQISHQHFLCWQHYKFRDNCSLGHHWPLLVNSAQFVCFSSAKKLGRNWVWGPEDFHRERQGWGRKVGMPSPIKVRESLLFLPPPFKMAFSLSALLFFIISYWYSEPIGVPSSVNPRLPGCWQTLE